MLQVYGRANSINVQKVMWTVAELELAHERHDVGGAFGGNDQPWFRALNPNGTVPTVDDEGTVVWESNAIVRYLAGRYGTGGLWPEDPGTRARADMWMDWKQTTVIPALRPVFWQLVRTPAEHQDRSVIDGCATALDKTFAVLDGWLAERPYVAGEQFTMGDIPLGAAVYRWYALPLARTDVPNVAAWYARLEARPAFRDHVMIPLT